MFNKRYSDLSWWKNFMSGHINIGPITIFGQNAMHWAINIKSKWGSICFRLPFPCFGRWWPLYFYISPDATPCRATYIIGNPD